MTTCWYTGEVCSECGQPEATDGRQVWCTNPDCVVDYSAAVPVPTTKEEA